MDFRFDENQISFVLERALEKISNPIFIWICHEQ
jgi:hypothetical protein